MNSNRKEAECSNGTSANAGVCQQVRTWLSRNAVFFQTIASVLLSAAAILVSWLQLNTANIQADVAQRQLSQQRRDAAITKARDWAALRELLRPIIERYPALGGLEIPALKNLSRQDKIKWLSEMEALVSSLGGNPILVASRHNYERYLAMLGDLGLAKRELLSADDPEVNSIFYQVTVRLGGHAEFMWWDLGMERGSRSPNDNIYKPTTPEESIFEKGFPWESEIRRKDAAQPSASTDADRPRR